MNYQTQFEPQKHLVPLGFRECPAQSQPGVMGILYQGARYHGKPTSCFAWLGLPEGASERKRVPGIVLVHGGGPEITELMGKLGKTPEFVDGLRVTDKETVDIAQIRAVSTTTLRSSFLLMPNRMRLDCAVLSIKLSISLPGKLLYV